MIDLAICIPSTDTVTTKFAFCLANLSSRLQSHGITHRIMFQTGSVLPDQRQQLGDISIDLKSTWTLWLDSDMVFPATTFEILSKHNKRIVAGSYSTRYAPYKSVAFMDEYDASQRLQQRTGLHKVSSVGMGCMLIKTQVLVELPKPWFSFTWDEGVKRYSGEDIYFCQQATDYEIPIWVDADFSEQLGHTGTKTYTMDDIYNV